MATLLLKTTQQFDTVLQGHGTKRISEACSERLSAVDGVFQLDTQIHQ